MLPEARAQAVPARHHAERAASAAASTPSAMATELADQFLRLLDIDPHAGDALRRLRAVDVPRLLQAQADLARATARFARPLPPFLPVAAGSHDRSGDAGGDCRRRVMARTLLIGATADEMHAFFAADPAMVESAAPNAVTARFGGEAMLARYRARRPGATDDGPAGRSRHRPDVPAVQPCVLPRLSRPAATTLTRISSIGRHRLHASGHATRSNCRSCSALLMRGSIRPCWPAAMRRRSRTFPPRCDVHGSRSCGVGRRSMKGCRDGRVTISPGDQPCASERASAWWVTLLASVPDT